MTTVGNSCRNRSGVVDDGWHEEAPRNWSTNVGWRNRGSSFVYIVIVPCTRHHENIRQALVHDCIGWGPGPTPLLTNDDLNFNPANILGARALQTDAQTTQMTMRSRLKIIFRHHIIKNDPILAHRYLRSRRCPSSLPFVSSSSYVLIPVIYTPRRSHRLTTHDHYQHVHCVNAILILPSHLFRLLLPLVLLSEHPLRLSSSGNRLPFHFSSSSSIPRPQQNCTRHCRFSSSSSDPPADPPLLRRVMGRHPFFNLLILSTPFWHTFRTTATSRPPSSPRCNVLNSFFSLFSSKPQTHEWLRLLWRWRVRRRRRWLRWWCWLLWRWLWLRSRSRPRTQWTTARPKTLWKTRQSWRCCSGGAHRNDGPSQHSRLPVPPRSAISLQALPPGLWEDRLKRELLPRRSDQNKAIYHYDLISEEVEACGGGCSYDDRGRGGHGCGRGHGCRRGGPKPNAYRPPLPKTTRTVYKIEKKYESDFKDAKIASDWKEKAYTAFSTRFYGRMERRNEETLSVALEDQDFRVTLKMENKVKQLDLWDYVTRQRCILLQECLTTLEVTLRTTLMRAFL